VNNKPYKAKDVILSVAPYSEGDRESPRQVEHFETPVHVHGDIWIVQLDREFF
jgi:hypothetical protein